MTNRTTHLLLTISPLALIAATPAFAQNQPVTTAPVTAASEGQQPDESTIVVTGTRRNDRTLADSPVPIDVIGGDQLTSSGLGETNKILNNLVPSFNFPQPSIADGTDAVRPASLRGLSPDQVLVLVNGKRRHVSALLNINGTVGRGSAAVDLNNIPTLAIERIEVLRDGAASQYGSDAIAGVINVRLKRASSGGRAQASYGRYVTTLDGVANVTGLALTGGQPSLDPTDGRYLAVTTDGERKVRDGDLWTIGANLGVPLTSSGGFVNLTAEYRDRDATNRQGFDIRPNYARPTSTTFDPREITFNRINFRYGDAKTEDYGFFLNGGLPLDTAGAEIYAFASYNKRDSESAANYRQQSNGVTGAGGANRDYSTIAPNTTPSVANFTPLTPDGYLPLIQTDLKDYSATLGVRGEIAGWKVDGSTQYGKNKFDYTIADTINASLGTASPRVFDAGGIGYGQFVTNLDFSREYQAGFAKPLSVAVGAEFRREDFQIRPGQLESYIAGPLYRAPIPGSNLAACTTAGGVLSGTTCTFPGRAAAPRSQGFGGFPASARRDVSRNNVSAYVELDTDPLPGWTTTVAARFERYSDFGTSLNGKFATRFEISPGIALRGAISNGFRAPSLQQQYFTTVSTNFISGVAVDILTLGVNDPVAQRLGAKPLKPEKSTNLSVGATLNPMRGLTVTIDGYQIKLKDRIVLTENLGASSNAATDTLARALINDTSIGAARFFINGLDTTTRGIDVVGNYRFAAGPSRWTLTAAYNYNKSEIDRRIVDLGPLAAASNIVLFGRVEGIRFEKGQPRDKVVLSADGRMGAFGLTARTTRYGKVVSPNTATPISAPTSLDAYGPDDVFLSPKWITDLELRASPVKSVEVALGANNLFDVYPDRLAFGPRPASVGGVYPVTQAFLPYSNFSPFGFNGRFLYGRVSVDF
ncbi:TonB-dependent receptor [Sphingomonas swuensis]|uniref:TonB-dependent receptor n=1 Tax=Sphingomonas swuensis TaxID=977800 RepID=A0ABP7SGB8_9SPHN